MKLATRVAWLAVALAVVTPSHGQLLGRRRGGLRGQRAQQNVPRGNQPQTNQAPATPQPAPSGGPAGAPGVNAPFETDTWVTPANAVDLKVLAALQQRGLPMANPCSDAVFIRRVYLDTIGTLPEARDVWAFLQDGRTNKRAVLIDDLLKRPEFADYWALKWCDLLRVKAEFPINLWPNAAQAYHRWVHDAIAENWTYDQFARELLTASGSNFRRPPVNFYRAVQSRDAAGLAEAVALTFMGSRIDKWPEARRTAFQAFFSRVQYKKTDEWKEEIVCLDPKPTDGLRAVYPDGATAVIPSGADPRMVFAAWLITRSNPWFSRAAVNRVWAWLMGRGIVNEPDDLRDDNPPSNPELLAVLQQTLTNANWDLRAVYRLILNSRTYQQSSIPRAKGPEAETQFAFYPVRRLEAEVLADALKKLTGYGDTYSSQTPEPFTYIPKDERSIALPDGSISSSFLEMFGRPARDTGRDAERSNKPSDAQRLYLLNSSALQRGLEQVPWLKMALQGVTARNGRQPVFAIYYTVLSRAPTATEIATIESYANGVKQSIQRNGVDLAWALMNTKEFLYRH